MVRATLHTDQELLSALKNSSNDCLHNKARPDWALDEGGGGGGGGGGM